MKNKGMTRKDFLRKTAYAAGAGSLLAMTGGIAEKTFAEEQKQQEKKENIKVPTRIFGKTKVPVSILSLGGIVDMTSNQILLKKSHDWGVTYWDTANGYNGGQSEIGIGQYFEKFPEARKDIFLVSKSGEKSNPDGITKMLNTSLERMKTDYIDLYFLHGLSSPDQLAPEIKNWAEKTKKEGKIKFFGFSTHSNMEALLMAASKLDYIDGIMMTYNYRLMHEDAMKAAVEACNKTGIGLTAMKTQGEGSIKDKSDEKSKMAETFLQKGFTEGQAKLKAVWENEMISCICSQMPSLEVLSENTAAALDKTKLSKLELDSLKHYAQATCNHYCAGCTRICTQAIGEDVPIGDVMRYMMYYRNYGIPEEARNLFNEIPSWIRNRLASLDFTPAEKVCPRKISIGKMMNEASRLLT